MIVEHRLAKLLSIVMIMAFVVSAGAVGCGPTAGPLPEAASGGPPEGEQAPGGQLPGEPPTGEQPSGEVPSGEEPPGGPDPGGEVQLVLVADPDMVAQGGCTTLHWEVAPQGDYRVLLNGQEVARVGEQQVCPPGTTTYELLVETPGGPQVRTLTVNVGGEPGSEPQPTQPGPGPQPTQPGPGPQPTQGGPAPTTAPGGGCAGAPTFTHFTASPSSISAGQQVQLSWGPITNGTSGPLVGSVVLTPGNFGEVGSPGSRQVSPTTTTTYRLTATGCGGTATKDVTVNVGTAAASATPTGPVPIITGVVLLPSPTPGSTTASVRLTNNCGRFIDSVYIRKSGESSWGNDRLGQNDYLGHGASRTFQLTAGDYEMRAECCGQMVVSEHSVRLYPGTYDWTVIASLDIHNDADRHITELYIVPSTQSGWGSNWLHEEPSWPGCAPNAYPDTIAPGYRLRCYFSPGSYDLKAVTDEGQVYTAQQANLQGNSAWYVKTQFWTPPAD